MEFKPFSPLYMLIQIVLVIILLGGNYLYVTWFIKTAEPGAKLATETRLGVEIERNILGSWTVPAKNLTEFTGSKFFLRTEVTVINLALMFTFVAGFLLEIILLYVLSVWLFKGSS